MKHIFERARMSFLNVINKCMQNSYWNKHHINIFQNSFLLGHYNWCKYIMLFSLLQVFSMSLHLNLDNNFISEDYILFSYDTYIENLYFLDMKSFDKNYDQCFKSKNADKYLMLCQILEDFKFLIYTNNPEHSFCKFIETTMRILNKIIYKNKIKGKISLNGIEKFLPYIEDIYIKLDSLKLMVKKNKKTIHAKSDDLKKYINTNIKNIDKHNNFENLLFYDFFCLQNNTQNKNNAENFKTFISFYDIFSYLNVPHGIYILTHLLMILREIRTNFNFAYEFSKQRNFYNNDNSILFLNKASRFIDFYLAEEYIFYFKLYEEQQYSYVNDDELNMKLKKTARISMSIQINERLCLYHSIYIFLLFALEFTNGGYEQWEIYKNYDVNCRLSSNLVIMKQNLEVDLKNLFNLNLSLYFTFNINEFKDEEFESFFNLFKDFELYNSRFDRFTKVLFLLSYSINFSFKETSKATNAYDLSIDLLHLLVEKLVDSVHDINCRAKLVLSYNSFLIFVVEWIRLFYCKNINTHLIPLICNLQCTGIYFYKKHNFLFYNYHKYDLNIFYDFLNEFRDQKEKEKCFLLIKMICLYYFRIFFVHEKKNNNSKILTTFIQIIKNEYI